MITLEIKHEFTPKQISDLLCSALEGGSNYWAEIVGKVEPKNWNNTPEVEERKFTHISYPMNEGGELHIKDIEEENGKILILNIYKIKTGLKRMAKKYPKQFQNIIEDNYDANDADIFFQFAVLGDCIYG